MPFEDEAQAAARRTSRACPSSTSGSPRCRTCTAGIGATVGSVIPTRGRDHPGGGRRRHRLRHDGGAHRRCARERPARQPARRCATAIEAAVPHGRTDNGGRNDRGAWRDLPPARAEALGDAGAAATTRSSRSTRALGRGQRPRSTSGTLGTGNHFIEVCLDEADARLGDAAPRLARRRQPHRHATSSSWPRRTCAAASSTCRTRTWRTSPRAREHFDDYVEAVSWAQDYARDEPRADDATSVVARCAARGRAAAVRRLTDEAVNCHHNYVAREHHYGENVLRDAQGRGARARGRPRHHPRQHGRALVHRARARATRRASTRCSHGAGRAMSRTEARSGASRSRTTRRRRRASSAARTRT